MVTTAVKAFVRNGNVATIICPVCNSSKNVSVAAYRAGKHSLKVRCGCGEVFQVNLDFRRHFRKSVNLRATYEVVEPEDHEEQGFAKVVNISLSGVGLKMSTPKHQLAKGVVLVLRFKLDDKQHSQMEKKAVVQLVEGSYVGVQFTTIDEFDRILGFYVQG